MINVIDYTTREGQKLYETATKALNITFDCSATNLRLFLDTFGQRSTEANWDATMMVPKDGALLHLV